MNKLKHLIFGLPLAVWIGAYFVWNEASQDHNLGQMLWWFFSSVFMGILTALAVLAVVFFYKDKQ